MKVCNHCHKKLPLSDFNWKIKNKKKASYCKKCSRAYIKLHYYKNRSYYLKKAKKRNKKIRDEAEYIIAYYFLEHPCIDCGETDIRVLEFDHRDKSRKDMPVSLIIRSTSSIKRLKTEIEKCDVRCANCHRKKTLSESDSWKLKYAPVAQWIEH